MQRGLKQTNSWTPSSIDRPQTFHGTNAQGSHDLAYRSYVADAIARGQYPLTYSDWMLIH